MAAAGSVARRRCPHPLAVVCQRRPEEEDGSAAGVLGKRGDTGVDASRVSGGERNGERWTELSAALGLGLRGTAASGGSVRGSVQTRLRLPPGCRSCLYVEEDLSGLGASSCWV